MIKIPFALEVVLLPPFNVMLAPSMALAVVASITLPVTFKFCAFKVNTKLINANGIIRYFNKNLVFT